MKRGLMIVSFFLSVLMGAHGLLAETNAVPLSDPYQKIRALTSVKLYPDMGLIRAIKQHDVQKVKESLLRGGSPNVPVGPERLTPLMIAVKSLVDFVETPVHEEGIISSIGTGMTKLMVGSLCACAGFWFLRRPFSSLLHPSENDQVTQPQPQGATTGDVPAAVQTPPNSTVPAEPEVMPGVEEEVEGHTITAGAAQVEPGAVPVEVVPPVVPQPDVPQVHHVGVPHGVVPHGGGAADAPVEGGAAQEAGNERNETWFGRIQQQGARLWTSVAEYGSWAVHGCKEGLTEFTRLRYHFPATARRVEDDLYPRINNLVRGAQNVTNKANRLLDNGRGRVDDLMRNARGRIDDLTRNAQNVTNKASRLLDGLMVLGGGSVGLFGVHQGVSGTYRLAAMPVKAHIRNNAIDEYFQIIEMLLVHPATDVTIRSESKKGSQQILEYIRDAQLDVSDECYEVLCEVEDMVGALIEPERYKQESK